MNRREAGLRLAQRLSSFGGRGDVIVLGLARGGVPVAYEVARALGAPLDVFIVRKLGVPGHEELAMGAIASGGVRVLNREIVRMLPNADAVLEEISAAEQRELKRREDEYRGVRPALDLREKTVILVDDGLATGASMRAAVAGVRQCAAARIVVAVPVGALRTCAELARAAGEVHCLIEPSDFGAVGEFYADFSQTTGGEVRELLARATAWQRPNAPARPFEQ